MLKFGGAQKPSGANGSSSNGLATANSALPATSNQVAVPLDAPASSEDKEQQRTRTYRNTPVAQWVGQTLPPERMTVQPTANPPAPTRPSFSQPTNPLPPATTSWRTARTQR